jgi:hypothetical protein
MSSTDVFWKNDMLPLVQENVWEKEVLINDISTPNVNNALFIKLPYDETFFSGAVTVVIDNHVFAIAVHFTPEDTAFDRKVLGQSFDF